MKEKKNKKFLKIAQIAPLWFPVPPSKYGGTERIVSCLTEGLIKKGHLVTLFASGDSDTKAKLVSVTKKALILRKIPWNDWFWNNFNYSLAFEKADDFDIIHSHWTPMGMYFQKLVKTPVLHTFHNLPNKTDHRWPIFNHYKESNAVFISKNQKKNCPVKFENQFMVYNGINVNQFKFRAKSKNHFVWIGRICPAKGTDIAVRTAKKMGINLILAGQLQPNFQSFFEKEIKPYLNSKIKYIGEISQKQLSSFYGQAKAFIYPLRWQEPFGLCMAEAMACGTPVIAFNRGSAPEVIKHKKTGFIVNNVNEMVKSIRRIDEIKRQDCRDWVEKNFTIEQMANNYEKAYYKIIN